MSKRRNTGKPGGAFHGQHPDHHITANAKDTYYECFPKRCEGLDDAAVYRRMATEIDRSQLLEVDEFVEQYLSRNTPGAETPRFMCTHDPRSGRPPDGEEAGPVFVLKNDLSKVITVWTADRFAEEHETARMSAEAARNAMAEASGRQVKLSREPEEAVSETAEPPTSTMTSTPSPDSVTGASAPPSNGAAPSSGPQVAVRLMVDPAAVSGLLTDLIAKGHARIVQGGIEVEFVTRRDEATQ